MHLPLIEIEGIGPLALPLVPVQAAQLIAAAERAPYGRGVDTLVRLDLRCADVSAVAWAAFYADCDFHLTLLRIEESGAAQYNDSAGPRC